MKISFIKSIAFYSTFFLSSVADSSAAKEGSGWIDGLIDINGLKSSVSQLDCGKIVARFDDENKSQALTKNYVTSLPNFPSDFNEHSKVNFIFGKCFDFFSSFYGEQNSQAVWSLFAKVMSASEQKKEKQHVTLNENLTNFWDENNRHFVKDRDDNLWNFKLCRYYEQDVALDNVLTSSVFNYLLPNSFAQTKFILSRGDDGVLYLSGTMSRDVKFMSAWDYEFAFTPIENESECNFEARRKELLAVPTRLKNVEEWYATVRYMGLSTPWSAEVGFSQNTYQVVMVNAAHSLPVTFHDFDGESPIPESCFISEPYPMEEYRCDPDRVRRQFKKIAQLTDQEIDRLVNEPFSELAQFYDDFETPSYQDYRQVIKGYLKENRDAVSRFLEKK